MKKEPTTKYACYLTYYGLGEPLLWSQALPYLDGIAAPEGVRFIIISFEKKADAKSINKIRGKLKPYKFDWYFLKYHKSVIGTIYDFTLANLLCLYLCFIKKVRLIHARGTQGMLMGILVSLLSGGKTKVLFDQRGFWVDEYADAGKIKRNSMIYNSLLKLEAFFYNNADYIVVLTEKAKEIVVEKKLTENRNNIEVIKCSVDTHKFCIATNESLKEKMKLSNKFVLIYVGSLGTWYMLNEMLDFFSVLKQKKPEAHFLFLTNDSHQAIEKRICFKNMAREDFSIKTVDPDQVPYYINVADFGIFFIRPCYSKLSSFPTKFAEYLACGLPVIMNRGIGDLDEIVKKYPEVGIMIKDFNSMAYQSAVQKLLSFREKKISLICRQVAETELSITKAQEHYKKIYRNLFSS